MKKFSFLLMMAIICVAAQIAGHLKQGVAGKIYLKTGDSMPVPGRAISNGKPVSRDVYVYQLTRIQQTTQNGTWFSGIKTKLIAKAKSDENGEYSVALPTGSYSVFVGDGDKFYANDFDGERNIAPIKVVKDSVSKMDVVIRAGAVN